MYRLKRMNLWLLRGREIREFGMDNYTLLYGGSDDKQSACNAETCILSLGWEGPLKKGMATHSSILAWRIPMDRGAWRATVHGVTKSQTGLSTAQHIFQVDNQQGPTA